MAIRLHRQGEDIFLSGAGTTGTLRWHRVDGRWACAPADMPPAAEAIGPEAVPDDLREELLAFITRADAMGNSGAAGPMAN